ncbi:MULTISPECIES: hypothetical protein [unclassified Agrococcus]|uniref:hypothetical protein n=1 Tax=unclassified Agrococcus TaxID=2615065 RepID=UPI00360CF3D2
MTHADDLASLIGATVLDRDGDRIGTVGSLFAEDAADRPSWGGVVSSSSDASEVLVPLHDATVADGMVRLGVDRRRVADAPRTDIHGALAQHAEDGLHAHYGLVAPAVADGIDHGATGTLGHSADAEGPAGGRPEGLSVDGSFTPASGAAPGGAARASAAPGGAAPGGAAPGGAARAGAAPGGAAPASAAPGGAVPAGAGRSRLRRWVVTR